MTSRVPVLSFVSFLLLAAPPPGVSRAAEPDVLQQSDIPHWVSVPGASFEITATEVTVRQFGVCVETGDCDVATLHDQCNYHAGDRDDHPVNCASYQAAADFCAHAGGRICDESEWLQACRGEDDRAFPYGSAFDLAACNVQSTSNTIEGRERATAPVAGHAGCEGGLVGLYDMAGNVAEWVEPCQGDYCKFRGAGYLTNDPVDMFAGCTGVCSGNDKSLRSGVVGIRCCRDATP